METKTSIRKEILQKRNELTEAQQEQKSHKITENILALPVIGKADVILCYASYKSEVQTTKLMEELLKAGKNLYLPKVNGDEMDFYRIKDISVLQKGYKDIPEPEDNSTDIFTKDMWEANPQTAVMLLPGAAFSEKGARIGYGKGYYDRYLSRIPCMERIALCYEFQVVDEIPADVHDIPVTMIVTEEKTRVIAHISDK